MKRLKGYTMIELVIVLALFGILLTITYPSYGFIDRFNTNQELKQLRRDILYTRNQAIVKGKSYFFNLDYDKNGYLILSDGSNVKRVNFESDLVLVRTSTTTSIEFERTGVPNGAGTIKIRTKTGKWYDVIVTPIIAKVNIIEVEND